MKKKVPSNSKVPFKPTGDAGGEVCPAGHLTDGLSLQLLHLFGLPVRGLISVSQLAHHLSSTLNILKARGRKPLGNKGKNTQTTVCSLSTHGPGVKLLLHRHHRKVTLACTHVLRTAATFKHVHFLGGVLAATPEVHLP